MNRSIPVPRILGRVIALAAIVFFAALGFGTPEAAAQGGPRITIFAPSAGAIWVVDSTYLIRWSVMGNVTGTLQVSYSVDSGATWKPIDTTTARSGFDSLAWKVPNDPSTMAMVRVATLDDSVSGRTRRVFTISTVVVPVINLFAPNGGQTYLKDSVVNIRWIGQNVSGMLDLHYSIDSGVSWLPIAKVPGVSGIDSFAWTVPDNPTTKGMVRVRTADSAGGDRSDRTFTIISSVDPKITLVRPNGGERYMVDSLVRVRWQAQDILDSLAIDLSVDGGATWSQLARRRGRSGADSANWRVASPPTETALLRIYTITGTAGDTSDNVFAIEANTTPELSLITQQTGQVYRGDSVVWVKWISANINGNIDVEYTLDSGVTWTQITQKAAVAGRDSVSWTVPDDSTTNAFVRVRTEDNSLVAMSMRSFTILPKVVQTVGIYDRLDSDVALQISPNPAIDRLDLRWSQSSGTDAVATLRDVRGAIVRRVDLGSRSTGPNVATIDVSSIDSGSYLLELWAGATVVRTSIVIVR